MPEMIYPLEGKRIYVAGHRGMVGSAIVRRLASEKPAEILTATSKDVDLRNQAATNAWMEKIKPDAVFIPAAKVGGIYANDTYPAEFVYDNLMIASNLIKASHDVNVEKLMFLGSSCIYPKFADQPIVEESLLTGELEPTNEWYAIAKIAGIKLCQSFRKQYGSDFISGMPTNLYGPGDNFHPQNSHVIPALIQKAHLAKTANENGMEIWGTGTPRREFLHADDCADAIVFLMKTYSDAMHVNVGSGSDVTIKELAELVMKTVGLEGDLRHDTTKPDGTPRKLMSADKLRGMGWSPKISLEDGLKHAYDWYLENVAS